MILNPYRFAAAGGDPFTDFGNSSAIFNGVDTKANAGSDASIDDIWNGGGTISFWVNIASGGEQGSGRFFDKRGGSAGSVGWFFLTRNEVGGNVDLRFRQHFGSGTSYQVDVEDVSINVWHHIAVTYDSSSDTNDAVIYVDGVSQTLVPVLSPTGSPLSDAANDFIIGNTSNSVRTYEGLMCDVRVFSSILSSGTISSLASGVDESTDIISRWILSYNGILDTTDSAGSNTLVFANFFNDTDGPSD